MGKAKRPQRVKLVIGMLTKNKKLFDLLEEFFVNQFGEVDYRSQLLLFDHTDYYKKEMGHPLKKRFISFRKLIPPEDIAKIKITTNSLEERFTCRKKALSKRRVNIDPGYISDSKLVLATTKDYFHRIYLNKGMYAEVTLAWKSGTFRPFKWTYPDYKTADYISILNGIRERYMKERSRNNDR